MSTIDALQCVPIRQMLTRGTVEIAVAALQCNIGITYVIAFSLIEYEWIYNTETTSDT